MRSLAYNLILTKDPKLVEGLFFDETPAAKTLKDVLSDRNNTVSNGVFVVAPNSVNSNGFLNMQSVFDGEGKSYVSLRMVETSQLLEFFTVAPDGWSEGVLNRLKEESIILSPEDQVERLAGIRSTFYLSFGVGEDVRKWTGPFAINMIDAKLSLNSDGVRELEILFTPTVDTMKAFTNRILNDASYRSKDSPFSNIEAQNKLSQKSCHITSVFSVNSKKPSKIKKARQKRDATSVLELAKKAFPVTSKISEWASKGLENVENNQRNDIKSQRLQIEYGRTLKIQDNYRWNYAIRYLIIEYLENLFQTIPRGNVLVLFDDDLDEVRSTSPVIIEPSLADRVYKSKVNLKQNIIKRCKDSLSKFGIGISYPKKGFDLNNSKNDDTKSKLLGGKVVSGDKVFDLGRAGASNPDANSEYTPRDRNYIALGLGVVFEDSEKDDTNPVLLKPLVTFQRRLAEVMRRPSDFTIYEETDLNTLRLLGEAGLVEDAMEPVVIFGRKSVIERLLYSTDVELDEKLLLGSAPYNTISAEDLGPEDLGEKWKVYRDKYVTFNKSNIKSRVSSFGETPIPADYRGDPRSKNSDVSLVFAHNVKDGNVLDLTFDSKPYAGNLLGYANRPVYRLLDQFLKTSDYQPERDTSLNFPFIKYIEDELRKLKESDSYKKDPKKSTLRLFKQLTEGEKGEETMRLLLEDEVAQGLNESDFFDLVLIKLGANGEGKFTVEQRADQGSIGVKEADLIQMINKSIIQVNIKTLPFFNSDIRIGSKCYLFGNPNYVIGSNIQSDRDSTAIYTNFYTVVGYKHFMSKSDSYSEFTLIQNGHVEDGSQLGKTLGERFRKQLDDIKDKIAKTKKERQDFRDDRLNPGAVEFVLTGGVGFLARKLFPELYADTAEWITGKTNEEEK